MQSTHCIIFVWLVRPFYFITQECPKDNLCTIAVLLDPCVVVHPTQEGEPKERFLASLSPSLFTISYTPTLLCVLSSFCINVWKRKKTRPVFTNRGRLESPETRRRSARFLAYPHICMWNPHYLHGVNTGRGLGRK